MFGFSFFFSSRSRQSIWSLCTGVQTFALPISIPPLKGRGLNGTERSVTMLTEINFDGIIGPSHNYAVLSRGNIASASHAGDVSQPRAAALQGKIGRASCRERVCQYV